MGESSIEFYTDFGVHYGVEFVRDDILLNRAAYHLNIVNANHRKSPNDPKVKDTIIFIVDEFFRQNNTTLLYICDTGDNKQSMRNRLFERWFETYEKRWSFTFISSSLLDEDNNVNYAAIILRNDNPYLKEIVNEFLETIELLGNKPTQL
ncbi:MAG: hypothetical protein J1E37_01190 [Prevotella sp.]|nr:hypothetical protein [Prevotella sp.]